MRITRAAFWIFLRVSDQCVADIPVPCRCLAAFLTAVSSGNHSQHFPVPIARRTTQTQGASLKSQLTRCLVIVSLFALSICAAAQSNTTHPATAGNKVATSDELFQTISQLDKQLFDAIDRCDMKAEASFWAADAEFYHDKDGLLVGGPQIVDAIKNNLCGKVKRELVPGTLEVYPLQGYGAVEGIGDSSREKCTLRVGVPLRPVGGKRGGW